MTRLPSTNHANPHPFPSFFDLRSQIVSKLTSCDRRSENVEKTGGEVALAWTTPKRLSFGLYFSSSSMTAAATRTLSSPRAIVIDPGGPPDDFPV